LLYQLSYRTLRPPQAASFIIRVSYAKASDTKGSKNRGFSAFFQPGEIINWLLPRDLKPHAEELYLGSSFHVGSTTESEETGLNFSLQLARKKTIIGVFGSTARQVCICRNSAPSPSALHTVGIQKLNPHQLELLPTVIAVGEFLLGELQTRCFATFEIIQDLILFRVVEHLIDHIVQV